MAKGIAMSRIEHGAVGKDGKTNVVTVFNAGDTVDLPDEVFKPLLEAGAVALSVQANAQNQA